LGQAVLVAGIGVGDVGLGFLEFGLTEFNDGAKTEIIAGSGVWLDGCIATSYDDSRTARGGQEDA